MSEERSPAELMYFQNYGLRNTWRNKCLKIPVSETLSTSKMVRSPNTLEIWTTPPLPYLLITVHKLSWRKYHLVICDLIRKFLNILTADDKYFLLNRDTLRQSIQRQLSQKWKKFSEFVSKFLKFYLKTRTFFKKGSIS